MEAKLIEGEDMVIAIEQYAAVSPGEKLTMFTHPNSFPEQLFLWSITREIIWHNIVPLLVINKR